MKLLAFAFWISLVLICLCVAWIVIPLLGRAFRFPSASLRLCVVWLWFVFGGAQ